LMAAAAVFPERDARAIRKRRGDAPAPVLFPLV